jgi:large subunit ribosomal protein L8e
MPEGTIVCNVERQLGDRGKLARASGNYATVVSHNPDEGVSRFLILFLTFFSLFLFLSFLSSFSFLCLDGTNVSGFCRVKLPSGNKIVVKSAARAMVGLVAGGGRIEKPILKAGRAHFKYKVSHPSNEITY